MPSRPACARRNGRPGVSACADPAGARRLRRARILALVLLLVHGSAAAVLLLTPDGGAVNRANVAVWSALTSPFGLQGVISPDMFQAVANIVLFVPAFAALAVLVPTWWWVAVGAVMSAGVETYQLVIGSRQASVLDVVMNTLGAMIGVAVGRWISARLRRPRRDRRTTPPQGSHRSDRAPADGAAPGAAGPAAADPPTRPEARPSSGRGPAAAPDDRE